MSARIAPDPIGSSPAAVGKGLRAPYSGVGPGQSGGSGEPSGRHAPTPPRVADSLPQLPLPPPPPGTNFAAAVLAGALPPRPETPAEAFRRLGSAWRPPSSALHLLDRVA